ncbi:MULTISPECIES: hypothetical protein [Pseudomonas]|uniref:Uncharacterized protein n=1 Tax=Pseudomonas quercus TaxID=2722792 RepID=A0ABX0YHD4_9PSED|nr:MULTISPECIES: hypothetical protein [Pseudomonas]MBF7143431.1 hypothetical protein [Pseudomonas sp. LY10J]NJP01734.1 hypothetical protein [Pseudomonas quercus]
MTTQTISTPSIQGPVSRRLAGRPTLVTVACDLLRPYFSSYIAERVDPQSLSLAIGVWQRAGDGDQFQGYRMQSLAYAVYQRYLTQVTLDIGDSSFVTDQSGSEYPRQVRLNIAKLAEDIDLVGPSLMEAWCEQMVMYFSTPDTAGTTPWAWLAEHMQAHLSLALEMAKKEGTLTVSDVEWVMQALAPSSSGASVEAGAQPVGLVVEGGGEPLPLLLFKQATSSPVFILYSLVKGFQRFSNLASVTTYLGVAVPDVLTAAGPAGSTLSLSEAWANALFTHYLNIQWHFALQLRKAGATPSSFERVIDACPLALLLDTASDHLHGKAVKAWLPDWLLEASDTQRLRYGLGLQHLLDVEQANDGKTFMSDIPTVEAYARRRLIEQAAAEHPLAPLVEPDDVIVTVHSRADDNLISVAGGGGGITLKEHQISLVEFAILNTGGRPRGWITVGAHTGSSLPAWLDHESVTALVKSVDVGSTYLHVLRDALSGPQSGMRRRLFCAGVSAQIPLLALELELRHQAGMDQQGSALVERTFATQASTTMQPTVAHLAFKAAPTLEPDQAAGLFVLSDPAVSDVVVLYAPLSREPLRQFAKPGDLMEAIASEPELQTLVMSGLSDAAQVRYRNGGFQAPRWLRFGLGSDFAPLPTPSPATLSPVAVTGKPLDAFYEGVVQALVLTADRQTVSNNESTWIFAREVSWLLFNQIMPFLSGSTAMAAWLIQLSHSLDEHYNSVGAGNAQGAPNGEELIYDVMVALFSEAFSRIFHGVADRLPPAAAALAKAPALDLGWATARATLTPALRARLQALMVEPPVVLPPAVPNGPFEGLYQVGAGWLARIDDHYFQVDPGDREAVILDSAGGTGPWVKPDASAQWHLDLRLRLRGGGPKRRIEHQRELNQRLRAQARQHLQDIQQTYRELRDAGSAGEDAIKAALAANDFETARARRHEEQARLEAAYSRVMQLHEQYDAIAHKVSLPEYHRELSTVVASEVNMCMYFLGTTRELLAAHLQANAALTAALKADATLDAQQTREWFAFLHEHLDTTEAAQRWRERLAERLEALDRIPVFGPRLVEQLAPKYAPFRTALEYQVLALYVRLSLLEEPMLADQAARESFHQALKPLVMGMITHTQMVRDPALVDGQAAEVLDGLVSTYQAAEDTIQWLKQTLRPEHVTSAMDDMVPRIAALRESAEAWLSRLIKAAGNPQPRAGRRPTPSASGAQRSSRHRVIRTRNRGTLVATVSDTAEGAREIAQMHSPLDGSLVAQFSPDPAHGDWVEQPLGRLQAQPAVGTLRDVDQLVYQADRQLQSATRQLEQAPRLAQATHIPVELEDLLVGSARELDSLAERIEHALTRVNETDVNVEASGSAELKARALRDMALRLKHEGRTLRIRLTKNALPTIARVRYLLDEGEVNIRKLGTRVPLKGQGKRKDIVQEYAVQDTGGAVLWYAHFHYPSLEAPDDAYTAAHLKTVSQRFVGLSSQMAQAASDRDVVKIYRSQIDAQAARKLFLHLP